MKRNRGFTLIELLAVIVVLAVIALIATPIVTKIIANSKRSVAIESANNLIRSAELYFVTSSPRYGKLDVLSNELSYNGTKPEKGEVEINKKGKSRIYAYIDGYCVTKEYEGETYASKTTKEECNWYATDNYETSEGTLFTLNNQSIKDYKIYGNSTQKVRSGKNLFDYNNINYGVYKKKENNGYFSSGVSIIRFGTYESLENYIGETVTISFDLKTSGTGEFKIYQYQSNGIGIRFSTLNKTMNANTTERISITGKVEVLGTNESYSKGEISIYQEGYTGSYTVSNIQFELGSSATTYEEYGAMPSPEFPSEIESVGDLITSTNCSNYGNDACNNVGKYVIPVKASGKNLFNIDIKESLRMVQLSDGSFQSISNDTSSTLQMKLQIKVGSNYLVSTIDNCTSNTRYSITFTAPKEEWEFIRFGSNGKISDSLLYVDLEYEEYKGKELTISFTVVDDNPASFVIKDIQLEEGTEATSYEPYVEPKITNIYLDEPLRKIGDTSDYIDFENKQIVRKVGMDIVSSNYKFNYMGSEWQRDGYTGWYANTDFENNSNEPVTLNNIFCNRFKPGGWHWSRLSAPYNYMGSQKNLIYFIIDNNFTKISVEDSLSTKETKIKDWFETNETKIYFPLETLQIENIDLPDIEVLEGYNNITINTNVQPSNVILTTNK